ncbi:hypothetical protein PLICRDRAFT_56563 [Plicaturopsis crispa FD-325 SS-3]|nr:hypothetical protein PLICRDRAFT_56563 [Plicaturopsis crispa FD-325 SS-3]
MASSSSNPNSGALPTSPTRSTPVPPAPAGSYSPERALEDLPAIKYAAALFLNSSMVESEEYCDQIDPKRERLYITSGYSLIQCLKALMSYEDKDLADALKFLNHGCSLAAKHRAPSRSIVSQVSGILWGASGFDAFKAMTPVQRHAELLYAETTFAKALIGSVSSGNWLGFIKEAMSFRTTINVYLSLGKYVALLDEEAGRRGEGPEDKSLDKDFRSGVQLGVGASNMLLSLMPKTVVSVAELFGYHGDRETGLRLLMDAGGWSKESSEPTISAEDEGLRRSIADIALLVFHLVISSFVFKGVDMSLAQIMLDWNVKRYPEGVFFLFGEGRLRLLRSQPERAIRSYEKAMAVQSQYHNLHYISFWEIAICNFALWDIPASLHYWRKLDAEATWSRACYAYGMSVCLLQLGGAENEAEATQSLRRIPSVIHKIAGKSIPVEKFIARKARKFETQGNRLVLPALEFAYLFLGITHAPRAVLVRKMLPEIDGALARLKAHEHDPQTYENGQAYWDDYALVHFLEGVCMRYIAYTDADAVVDPAEDIGITQSLASTRAQRAFNAVIQHAESIKLDHYIIYHAHYELGRLYACMGKDVKAREHFDLVLSGRPLEGSAKARKGKYSMQSALILRTTAALEGLGETR